MNDLAIIIPTKGRPRLARRVARSIAGRSRTEPSIFFVVCEGELDVYQHALRSYSVNILPVPDDATYPSKINEAAAVVCSSYRFIAVLNDDHVVETDGWDEKLIRALGEDPFGIAYGPDGVWEQGEVPSAPVITSSMYSALGWIALPGLNHILVDNVWKDLAEALGTCHYVKDVWIRHHHYTNGTNTMDATYEETSNQARQDEDSHTYFGWRDDPQGFERNVAELRGLA